MAATLLIAFCARAHQPCHGNWNFKSWAPESLHQPLQRRFTMTSRVLNPAVAFLAMTAGPLLAGGHELGRPSHIRAVPFAAGRQGNMQRLRASPRGPRYRRAVLLRSSRGGRTDSSTAMLGVSIRSAIGAETASTDGGPLHRRSLLTGRVPYFCHPRPVCLAGGARSTTGPSHISGRLPVGMPVSSDTGHSIGSLKTRCFS